MCLSISSDEIPTCIQYKQYLFKKKKYMKGFELMKIVKKSYFIAVLSWPWFPVYSYI